MIYYTIPYYNPYMYVFYTYNPLQNIVQDLHNTTYLQDRPFNIPEKPSHKQHNIHPDYYVENQQFTLLP
jgi:hypothetical protein